MNKIAKYFAVALFIISASFAASHAASCSRGDLTRCLDSACAINIGLNPAARCQLCGTPDAGTAVEDNGLRNLSIGSSSRNTLSATDLKSAPTDPGTRYAWAATQCIKKLSACTADDVSATYDSLIEQSCKAAGINAQMSELFAAARKTKTETTCAAETKICITDVKQCGANYMNCESNADFDRFFSECVVKTGGCDEYANSLRASLRSARDAAIKNQDTLLANIVNAYKTARETKLRTAEESCKNNKAKEDCIKSVCNTNMRNKCATGFESEKSMATLMCAFHDTACQRLK